mgnify:CR=1 FL=1
MHDLEDAFFSLDSARQSKLFITSFYEDERPLQNTTGKLDWRLRGALSKYILSGWITGTLEETIYIPVKYHTGFCHLLLVGLGKRAHANVAGVAHSIDGLKNIANKIYKLKFERVALSQTCFPGVQENQIKNSWKGMRIEFFL